MEFLTQIFDFLDIDFVDFIFYVVLFVFSCVSLFRNGRISKNIILFKEEFMKYRTANYREIEDSPGQAFDIEVDQYRLNKSTNELEVLPDKLDIQQVVQSSADMALPNMLQHLEPVADDFEQVVDVHNDLLDKLDYMREADVFRSDMCVKYGLDPRTSFNKVLDFLSDQEKFTRGQIDVLKNKDKEVVVNEETQVDSSKS